ncbi:MAG: CCA tRNA nucleotidyltransferase [Beijerinckiaceae bacterium]|nr:CCA tRNA nucleotidyltransferase [Beijerinckiaceae bacterium]
MTGAAFLDDPRLARVLAALDGQGEEARVVGGAVRNALLGEPVHEVDVTTTATPDVIIAQAKAAGLRTIPTGIEHGTVTILCEGETFEVTSLREDVETHGRHATVRFGRDFRADALRRDFTINQLSVDAHGMVHDYAGGLDDVAARRVRFIGDAQTRVREDYLRILRFFRFHAAYAEGPMDTEAMHACIALRHGLSGLSRERVHGELMKLLVARRAAESIEVMTHAGILGEAIAGAPNPARLARVKAIESANAMAPDAVLRLAALAVQVEEDALRLRANLRLSNAHEARLVDAARALAPWHGRVAPPGERELRAGLYRFGRQGAVDGLMLTQAESGAAAGDSGWRAALGFLQSEQEPKLPVSGADFMARGLKPGPAMGAALKRFEAAWIAADFPADPAKIAGLADAAAKQG